MSKDRHEPTVLNRTHYNMLKWAIARADEWRGELIGSYPGDAESEAAERDRLDAHDQAVYFAKQGLKIIRRDVLAREKVKPLRYKKLGPHILRLRKQARKKK